MKARKTIFWAATAAEVALIALALYGYFFAILFALSAHALADRAIEKRGGLTTSSETDRSRKKTQSNTAKVCKII